MTLVELLVVVAILGTLAVVALPLVANTSESRKTREATRSFVSYIASAQSRVLRRAEWGGFWIVPVAGTAYALDLFIADVPPLFKGDTFGATITGSSTFAGSTPSFVLSGSIAVAGDLIRFDSTGPWYSVLTSSTSSTSVTLRAGDDASQTALNTPWPAPNVPHTFEVMRKPSRSGTPFTFGDGRCLDLAQSGYIGSAGYVRFGDSPGPIPPIAIVFDGTGCIRQLTIGSSRISPTGPIYLLVGRADRAVSVPPTFNAADDSTGYNWQYSDSYWVGLDPNSGVVKVAECTPNSPNDIASQSFIRSQMLATAR